MKDEREACKFERQALDKPLKTDSVSGSLKRNSKVSPFFCFDRTDGRSVLARRVAFRRANPEWKFEEDLLPTLLKDSYSDTPSNLQNVTFVREWTGRAKGLESMKFS